MLETFLLTGATGYLGSRLLREFVNRSIPTVILVRRNSDLKKISGLREHLAGVYFREDESFGGCFDQHLIGSIVHCATNYGRNGETAEQIEDANVRFPESLVKAGLAKGLRRFINVDSQLAPEVNAYSRTKASFRSYLERFANQIFVANVAIEHFYGPFDEASKFVTWIVRSLLAGEKELKLTAGGQRRDFIYIDDVVSAFLKILEESASRSVGLRKYEVGSGQTISVRQLVETLASLVPESNTKLSFGQVGYRANELMESRVDLAPLRALGWEPTVGLEEGLRRLVTMERNSRKDRA